MTDIVVPTLQSVHALLGRIETDVANIKEDMRHIKVRLTSLEANMIAMNRRMDGFDRRLERIEQRLAPVAGEVRDLCHPGRREAESRDVRLKPFEPPGNRGALVRETGGRRADPDPSPG